jgi:hypothetical protein
MHVAVRRLLLSLVFFAACKDHADTPRTTAQACERVHEVCPEAIPPSPDDATQCADAFKSRCGAELRQYVQCSVGKCDDAGAVDRVEVERACVATIEAYRACIERDGGEAGPDEGQLPPFVIDAGTD